MEGGGEREIIYVWLHCHHQNDFCIKKGSDESHFNVSVGSDGQSHKTASTNHKICEEKGDEGALFISAQLSTDAVSALRKVWVLTTLRAPLSGTFFQTLPDLVTPLKRHSIFISALLSTTRSAPSERFGY